MGGNILDIMAEQYPSFTKLGKQLIDYCRAHAAEVAYLPISTLSKESGVSEATITRFCRQLGLRGYHEFKLELAKAGSITDLGDDAGSVTSFSSEDSPDFLFRKLYNLQVTALTETLAELNAEAVSKAASLLLHASHVYCMGSGGSMVTAKEAWARFITVTNQFVAITDSHMQIITAALATEQDVLLFFSYSGATQNMEDLFTTARERHVPIILITHVPNSLAAKLADVVLVCGCKESPLQTGSIAAKISQMFVIECLFYAYCQMDPYRTSEARNLTAKAVAKKLL